MNRSVFICIKCQFMVWVQREIIQVLCKDGTSSLEVFLMMSSMWHETIVTFHSHSWEEQIKISYPTVQILIHSCELPNCQGTGCRLTDKRKSHLTCFQNVCWKLVKMNLIPCRSTKLPVSRNLTDSCDRSLHIYPPDISSMSWIASTLNWIRQWVFYF